MTFFVCRINIVDDDIDLSQLVNATEAELDNYNLGEDLPQIAGIVDERPAELIAKEDYKTSRKWRTIGDGIDATHSSKNRSADTSPPRRTNRSPDMASPPRQSNRSSGTPYSKSQRNCDASPQRRPNRSIDTSPPRRSKRSSDASPPRQSNRSSVAPYSKSHKSPDASPKRRSNRSYDTSPPRRSNRSPDASPPRQSSRRKSVSPLRHPNAHPHYSYSKHSPKITKKASDSPPPTHKKMLKTLEGKVAGLQDAKALREENEQHRKREDEMFKKMQEKHKYGKLNECKV